MIVVHQPEWTAAASSYPYSEGLEDRYKYKTSFGTDVNMSVRVGAMLHVPRETCPIGKLDYRVASETKFAIDCTFVPVNDEQEPLTDLSLSLLRQGVSHIFEAPTGWGKSVAGGRIACKFGERTLIVVNKEDLIDSWRDALINVLGVPANKIGLIQQDTCDWEGRQIVIGMIHSLVIPERYPQEMYRYFGLMIVDECDVVAADTFVNVCWKFPAKMRLGFTATTRRGDGKWPMVTGHLGEVRVVGKLVPMSPKVLVKKTKWAIPTYQKYNADEGHFEPVKIPYSPGKMMGVYKAMAENPLRNHLIMEFVVSAFKAERITLILADTNDHLDRLFQIFTSNGISGDQIGYYVGGMSKIELGHTKKKPVVLATYKMCERGTNVPHWNTLVMATPRANVQQAIGRVIRFVEGKREPVILDLVDYDKIFNSFYLSRLRTYYSVKSTVVQM